MIQLWSLCVPVVIRLTLVAPLLAIALPGCTPQTERPNFIVILTDDQGYADTGRYGAIGFETPNLDRLADEGLRFTDFYVPATVCTPSRAALLTGSYPKRVGLHEAVLFPYSEHGLNLDETTIPELLKPLGYRTGMIGKWHLGHQAEFMPTRQGFDSFFGVPYSNDMDGHLYRGRGFQSPPLPLYENEELVESGPDQAFLTKRYTEAAVQFIKNNVDDPFFLYLAHNMPHLPLHASAGFAGTSERGLYGDVIQEIDWSVGEILAALEEAGLDQRTLIVFASDNGPVLRPDAGSAGNLRGGKATTWEGGMRVPGIVHWPSRIPKGSVSGEVATTMDLLPTLVSLAGGEMPQGLDIDGHDISPLLFQPGDATSPYDALYYYSRDGLPEAIREGAWKLHVAKSRGWNQSDGEFPISLFNLEADPGETQNVADDHLELVERLKEKLVQFDAALTREARPVGQLGGSR